MNRSFIESGKRLAQVFDQVLEEIKPGKKLSAIDSLVERLILQAGGKPSFKSVPNYSWASCVNLNQGVVHGIPDQKMIKKGDLVSLDVGFQYQGWHSDMAFTLVAGGKANQKKDKFLKTGEKALRKAIDAVKPGNRVGHISKAIQETIEGEGYHCSYQLTGHGIGKKLHQLPWIPCLLNWPVEKTPFLESGMGLAIEVIYMAGRPEVETEADGWTIRTSDGKMSALFEKTVLVTQKGVKIITPYNWGELIV